MPEPSPPRSPRRFADFELLEKLGQGGMSSVYKARDTRTQSIVALKIASHLVIHDRQLSRRFEQEFAIAQPLHHPNLVKVIANGKHDKIPYLVMEFIDGPSLAQSLRRQPKLSENDALAIILPIAEALAYLHGKQIIHRDIKPANILMTSTGEAKLADLGLVKNLESLSQLTRSNFGLGTMQFAAPEQFDDARSADVRSDVYSLAATMYLMLTGDYPFGKGAMLSVLERKLHNKVEPPSSKLPGLRRSIDVAIQLGLNSDRAVRPASIRDFTALLIGEKKTKADPPSTASKSKSIKKDVKERRGGTRFPVSVAAACRAVVNVAGQRWQATITDLSKTGLCVLAKRRFEVGSMLEISFTLKTDDTAVTQIARVRWSKQTESKGWLLGCEFINAIGDDELDTICADGMDHTRML